MARKLAYEAMGINIVPKENVGTSLAKMWLINYWHLCHS